MITERDIAEKFSIIWKQHFSLLTPNFMKVFNETQIKTINKNPVPQSEDVRYDLISEMAFNLSDRLFVSKISPEQYLLEESNINELTSFTATSIWKSGNFSDKDLVLSESEKKEVVLICNNICEFIRITQISEVQFKPKLKGYSFIPDLVADLSIDDTLFELKTVNRNFKSSDLKQLFIYLALQQVSVKMKWKYAGLYNPKRGTYCKFNIKSLIYNLTGGNSPNETFENLLNSLVRDIQIDSRF